MGIMHNPVALGEVDDILRPSADSNPLLERGVVTTSASLRPTTAVAPSPLSARRPQEK